MNKYNLSQLLDGVIEVKDGDNFKEIKLDGIQIPIIQRDYVQGLESVSVIRDRFLNVLFDALSKGNEVELDFVYGSIKSTVGNANVFLPLDGQQRLTTLFLLSWYIGNRELEGDSLKSLQSSISRFTYATRQTAASFCENLAGSSFEKNPVTEIVNSVWFHKRYELDPTVMAMLSMLGQIHKRYQEFGNPMFEHLSKLKFYILPLDGFDLTDELYIKMNARGKQLTDFENLKADINDWMINDQNPLKESLSSYVDYHTNKIPHYLRILSKIDNEWTQTIWQLAKKADKAENRNVDKYFMRFMSRFILTYHIDNSKLSEIENSQCFRHFYSTDDNQIKYSSFNWYQEIFEDKEKIIVLEKILDSISANYDEIIEIIRPSWSNSNWSFFDEKITQQQRILFFGICKYLEKNDFESESFKCWIRVIWNIAIDPDIRSIGVMLNIMKLVSELSEGCNDIYGFFSRDDFNKVVAKTKNFAEIQLKEEKIKADYINQTDWKSQILEVESHGLFQGNIGFLIDDYPTIDVFTKRVTNARLLFDKSGADKNFAKNHEVFRYVIRKFENWSQILNFDYTDSYENWQLILRRNMSVRGTIKELCSLETTFDLKKEIEKWISSDSVIRVNNNEEESTKLSLAHTNLYKNTKFFNWIQQHGLKKIKWLNEHCFIVRPNAWYDKVMIDCFRNELINEIDKTFELQISDRCGDSIFFKGEVLSRSKFIDNRQFSFTFLNKRTFKIEEIFEEEENNELFKFDYNSIRSLADLTDVMNKINLAIADYPFPHLTN